MRVRNRHVISYMLVLVTTSLPAIGQRPLRPNADVMALLNRAETARGKNSWKEALALDGQAFEKAEALNDTAGQARALFNIGRDYLETGQPQKGLEYLERAVPIIRQTGPKAALGAALGNIGTVCREIGQSQKALEYFQQALQIYKEVGDKGGEG